MSIARYRFIGLALLAAGLLVQGCAGEEPTSQTARLETVSNPAAAGAPCPGKAKDGACGCKDSAGACTPCTCKDGACACKDGTCACKDGKPCTCQDGTCACKDGKPCTCTCTCSGVAAKPCPSGKGAAGKPCPFQNKCGKMGRGAHHAPLPLQ